MAGVFWGWIGTGCFPLLLSSPAVMIQVPSSDGPSWDKNWLSSATKKAMWSSQKSRIILGNASLASEVSQPAHPVSYSPVTTEAT